MSVCVCVYGESVLTIIIKVAGPMKLQMKYVSSRSQHLQGGVGRGCQQGGEWGEGRLRGGIKAFGCRE